MTSTNEAYSLLRRLTLAFTVVAILVLSLAGGLLYHSLSEQLRQRDDDEISVKLNEFGTRRANSVVAVAVTNNGQAIPAEHLGKIFDRFYRIDAARQGSAKNMGLGLAIVKSIMELHRGRVDVESRAGATTFTLCFPSATA